MWMRVLLGWQQVGISPTRFRDEGLSRVPIVVVQVQVSLQRVGISTTQFHDGALSLVENVEVLQRVFPQPLVGIFAARCLVLGLSREPIVEVLVLAFRWRQQRVGIFAARCLVLGLSREPIVEVLVLVFQWPKLLVGSVAARCLCERLSRVLERVEQEEQKSLLEVDSVPRLILFLRRVQCQQVEMRSLLKVELTQPDILPLCCYCYESGVMKRIRSSHRVVIKA